MKQPIFSISGLRGVVGKTLFKETAREIASAYGRFLAAGVFAIGRDTRPTSEELAQSAAAGLKEAGCQVIELGICPTPTVVHFVRANQPQIKGGLVITASHNPLEWNGMKFVTSPGRFLLPDEFDQFRLSVNEGRKGGERKGWGIHPFLPASLPIESHIKAIVTNPLFKEVKGSHLRIGVDAVHGAASIAAEKLLQAFGCEVVKINCAPERLIPEGFPRAPEPTAENITALAELIKREKLNAGFAFDPDGDRFSCIDENGNPLGEEATICLACLFLLPALGAPPSADSSRHLKTVVVNLSTTQAVEDLCTRFGVRVERAKVGEAWVVWKMLETGAELGGEGNGGVILPEINFTRDGLVASAMVIGLLSRTKRSLSEIRQEIPRYYMEKSVIMVDHFAPESLIAASGWRFGDRTEGLRLAGEGWWLHIRKSNTEPLVRVVCEAKEPTQAKLIVEWVRSRLMATI